MGPGEVGRVEGDVEEELVELCEGLWGLLPEVAGHEEEAVEQRGVEGVREEPGHGAGPGEADDLRGLEGRQEALLHHEPAQGLGRGAAGERRGVLLEFFPQIHSQPLRFSKVSSTHFATQISQNRRRLPYRPRFSVAPIQAVLVVGAGPGTLVVVPHSQWWVCRCRAVAHRSTGGWPRRAAPCASRAPTGHSMQPAGGGGGAWASGEAPSSGDRPFAVAQGASHTAEDTGHRSRCGTVVQPVSSAMPCGVCDLPF